MSVRPSGVSQKVAAIRASNGRNPSTTETASAGPQTSVGSFGPTRWRSSLASGVQTIHVKHRANDR